MTEAEFSHDGHQILKPDQKTENISIELQKFIYLLYANQICCSANKERNQSSPSTLQHRSFLLLSKHQDEKSCPITLSLMKTLGTGYGIRLLIFLLHKASATYSWFEVGTVAVATSSLRQFFKATKPSRLFVSYLIL